MSLLDVGKACYQCSTVDFLPFSCPQCSHSFCRAHVHSHGCSLPTTESHPEAGPSTFSKKVTCEYGSCGRPRIEAIAGVLEAGGIGKQVRCHGCQGAFCTTYVECISRRRWSANGSHRSQESHACSGPLQTHARQDAFLERRAKAKELIAQKFPEIRTREIPKLPPQKDVVKQRPPSPERLPPSLQSQTLTPPPPPSDTVKAKSKSKAEKLLEIELRKLRSLAKPLDPKMRADGERRFFQWAVGSTADIEVWKEKGKIDKKWEKVWVPVVSSHLRRCMGLIPANTHWEITGCNDRPIQTSSSERSRSNQCQYFLVPLCGP